MSWVGVLRRELANELGSLFLRRTYQKRMLRSSLVRSYRRRYKFERADITWHLGNVRTARFARVFFSLTWVAFFAIAFGVLTPYFNRGYEDWTATDWVFVLGYRGVLSLIMFVTLIGVIRATSRRAMASMLVFHVLEFGRLLERYPLHRHNTDSQRRIVRRLEKWAKTVERIPLASPWNVSSISRDGVGAVAVPIATRLREFQYWVTMPVETTQHDLEEFSIEALLSVIRMHWYELPKSRLTPDIKAIRRGRILWIGLFIVVFAMLVALGYWQAQFGLAGSIGISTLSLIMVFVLSRLGVQISALKQAAEVGSVFQAEGHSAGASE